jgi:simple sugar transport system ATP-binding protein
VLSEQFGLYVELEQPVRDVSVGVQQRVEILKLLYRQAQLLILDEPTAVLTPQEVDNFFEVLHRLSQEGRSIILITHKLKEVMNVCQYATVLRQGRVIDTIEVAGSSKEELARMMVGREVEPQHVARNTKEVVKPVLVLEKVSALDERKLPALRQISTAISEGEILGIAGVEGNGQSELVEVICGLRDCTGDLQLNGQRLSNLKTRKIRELGLAVVPENRNSQGLNLNGSISENLVANRYYTAPFSRYGVLSWSTIRNFATEMIDRFGIRADGPDAEAATLSGGNAQKIVVAREPSVNPVILVVSHPTRGLDVAAAQNVRQKILRMRDENVAILLISADLDELLAIADRIQVLFGGQIAGEVDPKNTTYEELGLLMAGHVKGG